MVCNPDRKAKTMYSSLNFGKQEMLENITHDLIYLLQCEDSKKNCGKIAEAIYALFECSGKDVAVLDRVNMELSWIISSDKRPIRDNL